MTCRAPERRGMGLAAVTTSVPGLSLSLSRGQALLPGWKTAPREEDLVWQQLCRGHRNALSEVPPSTENFALGLPGAGRPGGHEQPASVASRAGCVDSHTDTTRPTEVLQTALNSRLRVHLTPPPHIHPCHFSYRHICECECVKNGTQVSHNVRKWLVRDCK